jgi:hypothetical protein
MEVYAFEWCDCVHESAFAVESLHTTKRGAVAAMVREANRRWIEERRRKLIAGCRSVKFDPLVFQAWRIRRIHVDDGTPNDQHNRTPDQGVPG